MLAACPALTVLSSNGGVRMDLFPRLLLRVRYLHHVRDFPPGFLIAVAGHVCTEA